MKQLRLPLVGLLFGFSLCLNSCVKDVDVNQPESSAPLPILDSELISSTLEATDFMEDGKSENLQPLTDTLNLAPIRSDFFIDEIEKINLSFKFINSLNANFKVDFEFLNDDNDLKYTVQVPISSGSIEKPISVETIVTIKEPELKIFKEATKLVYRISGLQNSKPFTPETKGTIELQSKASFLLDM